MAGAPRTRNDRIASQTAGTSRHATRTSSPGSRVWSIRRTNPVAVVPTQPTVSRSVVPSKAGSLIPDFLLPCHDNTITQNDLGFSIWDFGGRIGLKPYRILR